VRAVIGALCAVGVLGAAGCGATGSSGGGGNASPSGKDIKIGLASVLSGPASAYGNVGNGARAYFRMVNDRGGVNGYKYSFVERDTAYEPSRAATVARDMAQRDKVFAIITEGSPAVQGIIPQAKSLGVPVFAAADGDLMSPPIRNVFGQNPRYSRLPLIDAEFIMGKLGQKQFGYVYENDAVGLPGSKTVPPYVKQHGGKLLTSTAIDLATKDFAPFASRLKRSGAKAVLAFLGTQPLAGLQKAAAAIGYKPKWVTLFASQAPEYLELAGPLAQGVYADGYQLPLPSPDPSVTEFHGAMQKYYPSADDSTFSQQGWNFAAIVQKGVEMATQGGKALTREGFLNAVNSLSGDKVGMLPSVDYSQPDTHSPAQVAGIFQIKGKQIKLVQDFKPLPEVVK
jgi:branched-chain amino acid transport system substrate-binding protein